MKRVFYLCIWTVVIVSLFTGMARAENKDEGDASSKQLLLQAVQFGSELTPPGAQIDLYRTIAGELAAMGDMSGAVQLSQTFDVKRGRDDVLLCAVQGAIRENRLEQAVETIKLIEGEYEKDSAVSAISLFHGEAGNFTDAVAIISTMTSGSFAAHTLSLVVPFMVRAGHLSEAIDAALGLEYNHSKAQVISSIVAEQFKLGDTEAARKTATEHTAKIHNQWPILALSNSQAHAGMIAEAKETASQLNEQLHFFALGHIAEELAKSGQISQALNLASSIPSPLGPYEDSPTTRYRTIKQIVQIQAQRGDYTGALSTALTIPSTMSACDICDSLRGEAIGEIGKAQAERGDYDLAIRTAEGLKKSTAYHGDEVIKAVALAYARQGQIEKALKTSKRFRSRDYRAGTYRVIAEEWVKQGDSKKVLNWASRLPLRVEKAYALVGIARGMMQKYK